MYSLSFSTLQPSTFIAVFTFCLLVRAWHSVDALDKRSGDEHDVIRFFSTDLDEDDIILNEENLRPEYSQTEDTATFDDFRLQGIMRNLREKKSNGKICHQPGKTIYLNGDVLHECTDDCLCKKCVPRP